MKLCPICKKHKKTHLWNGKSMDEISGDEKLFNAYLNHYAPKPPKYAENTNV